MVGKVASNIIVYWLDLIYLFYVFILHQLYMFPMPNPYPISFFIRTFRLLRLGIWAIFGVSFMDLDEHWWFCRPFWCNIIGKYNSVLIFSLFEFRSKKSWRDHGFGRVFMIVSPFLEFCRLHNLTHFALEIVYFPRL